MKVLHITDTSIYNYDGISTYVNELLECFEKRGDETMVLTTFPHKSKSQRKSKFKDKVVVFPCIRFPGRPKFITVFTFGLKKTIRKFNPDIVWIHTIGTIGIRAAQISKGKYKVVYTKHCFDGELWCTYLNVKPFFHPLFFAAADICEKIVLRNACKVVYHIRDTSKVEGSKYFNKFLMLSPPLNPRFFEHLPDKTIDKKKLTLGFCGRCDPDKGIETTFMGIEMFVQRHPDIDIEFILIGDGPEALRMQKKYSSLKIHVTGFVKNVIPHLDLLDAFILSSKHETISLSSLEAYARGITIFSMPIGYLSEQSVTLNKFYLFETPENLADLIFKVLIDGKTTVPNNSTGFAQTPVIGYDELCSNVLRSVLKNKKET